MGHKVTFLLGTRSSYYWARSFGPDTDLISRDTKVFDSLKWVSECPSRRLKIEM